MHAECMCVCVCVCVCVWSKKATQIFEEAKGIKAWFAQVKKKTTLWEKCEEVCALNYHCVDKFSIRISLFC
jgi:hypothetical protein